MGRWRSVVRGWGTSLTGYRATRRVFESLKLSWSGNTLYLAGPTTAYAKFHETGTSKMAARPFARPAAARVQANPQKYAERMARTQQLDISTEEGFVRAIALAVRNEMKKIAHAKDIRDTGDTIASISIVEVES